MDEFNRMTKSNPMGRGRLFDGVSIELAPFDGKIHLSDIVALDAKSEGKGTKALKMLTDLADRHNVMITGTAKGYSDDPRHINSSGRLKQWYTKHGFTVTGGSEDEGFEMFYKPTRPH